MAVAVSACLLGENCKYSGGNNRSLAVLDFIAGREVIPVCPEVAGGLPVPRPPAEIVDGVVTNCLGESVDAQFRLGAERCLKMLEGKDIECTSSGTLTAGEGVFARMARERGYRVIGADRLER